MKTKRLFCAISGFWVSHKRAWVALCGLLSITPASVWATDDVPGARPSAPVVLWGVQRGCDPDPAVERAILRRLRSLNGTYTHPQNPITQIDWTGSEQMDCVAEQCAELLRKNCKTAVQFGQLIGGEIDDLTVSESGGPQLVSRIRLWRYDLDSKRTFYQTRLCHKGMCGDRGIADATAQMASQLLERPVFEADPRSVGDVRAARLPLCAEGQYVLGPAPSTGAATDRVRSIDRLYQNIHMALAIDPAMGSEQKAVADLFSKALSIPKLDGFRDTVPLVEVRSPEAGPLDPAFVQRGLQAMARLPSDRKGPSRLLVVQVGRRGELLTLDFRWLPTSDAEAQEYDFPSAGYSPSPSLTLGFMNVNALGATLRNERVAQMNRVRLAVERRVPQTAVDLCRPMPTPRCASPQSTGPGLDAPTAPKVSFKTSHAAFSPSLGALWGVSAASAVTFAVLTALDQARVGGVSPDDYTTVYGGLRSGMAVSGGAAALSLGLAIPLTVFSRKTPQNAKPAETGNERVCRLLGSAPSRPD